MGEKTWTYDEITRITEIRIRICLESAAQENMPAWLSSLNQQWAYGAYATWSLITEGWQKEGDNERLEVLATSQDKQNP